MNAQLEWLTYSEPPRPAETARYKGANASEKPAAFPLGRFGFWIRCFLHLAFISGLLAVAATIVVSSMDAWHYVQILSYPTNFIGPHY